ncbi:MAG: tetratricopeptide repeat protein [Acidobacteriaceae bacterium]
MHDDPTLPLGDSPSPAAGVPEARDSWGPFRLLARVGSGGFGEVYRAWDPNLEREVALKLLLPGAVGGEEEYKSMLREARAVASVTHPNIVHVYGIDRHDGRVGFWTDFVKGKTLSALLGSQGPFGYREAALIGIDLSRALSAVHRAGLLHRDIKAENVMREEGGRILLMDFGLSAGERHLGTQIAGTPNYMAPELFDGSPATVCSDIYALGVLLYYLVIAEYPARLTGLTATEAKEALAHRTPLMDLRSDLPEPFLRTVRIAMELDPTKRFASAGALAETLNECLGTGSVAVSQPISVAMPPAPPPPPVVTVKAPATWSNLFGVVPWFMGLSRKWKWAIFALVVILGQRAWRWPSVRPHAIAVPSAPAVPAADVSNDVSNNDDEFAKAMALLQKPYKDSNVVEAVDDFKRILQQDPNSALAEAALGSAYYTQYRSTHDAKLLELAKAATNKARQMDPNLAVPLVTLAHMECVEGRTSLALEHVQAALKINPTGAGADEANAVLADVYQAQGRTADAMTALQKAIDLKPEDSRWQVRMGNFIFAQGDVKLAAASWQRAIELDPENVYAQFNLGLADMQLDKLDDARSQLQKAAAMQPDATHYTALGEVLQLQGKYSEAIEMDRKAVNLDPNDYNAWGNLASAYQWSGNHDKALEATAKAIGLAEAERVKTPEAANILVALADYYASSGKGDRGLPLLRKALALAPDSPHIAYQAGATYELLGQREKAIPLIVRALVAGSDANVFQRSPEMASLRADVVFQTALATAKAKAKKVVDNAQKVN